MSSTLSAVRRSRIPAIAAAMCTVAAGLTLGLPAAHAAPVTEWEFTDVGVHPWTAPDGVHQVYVELYGARGGGSGSFTFGGYGAVVTTVLDVIPGDTYQVYVGGPGDGSGSGNLPHAGGFNGGGDGGARGVNGVGAGGGGATDIRWDGTALADRILIAGGGGGGDGQGGAAEEIGAAGADYSPATGGGGGTASAGGAAGTGASPGALGVGGAGSSDGQCRYTGAGGGGGLYGGGGGGCVHNDSGAGGGGGSSFGPEGTIFGTDRTDGPDVTGAGYAYISLLMPPSAPGAPSVVAGDSAVTATWTEPDSSGDGTISGYTATAAPGGASCTTAGALTCEITGLTNGTAYTVTVVATSEYGDSDPSEPSGPVTPVSGTVVPTVSFPARAAFLTSYTVVRGWGDPIATLRSSTPSTCRVSGARVVLLHKAGLCRVAVSQDGSVVARGSIRVGASGSGTPLSTGSIKFRGGSLYLTAASRARLAAWAPSLRRASVVVVTGWVSGMRTKAADKQLSAQRARVVARYLRSLDVRVTTAAGAGSHWLGSSSRSRAAQVSWMQAPAPV